VILCCKGTLTLFKEARKRCARDRGLSLRPLSVSLCHCATVTVSLCHCVTVSSCHSVTVQPGCCASLSPCHREPPGVPRYALGVPLVCPWCAPGVPLVCPLFPPQTHRKNHCASLLPAALALPSGSKVGASNRGGARERSHGTLYFWPLSPPLAGFTCGVLGCAAPSLSERAPFR